MTRNVRRLGSSIVSALLAAIFLGLFANPPFEWNTVGYWAFVAGVFGVAFVVYGQID
jgi:uncharacterized membrane protein YdcZ (DUF606 family)